MTLKIGEKIKTLRKKANVTQEKFADYLGVTFQAVSRWESGVCYPDIEIIPSVANFFNITTDELLGVDIMNKQERIEEIKNQVQANFNKGLIDENITILRTAVNEFPNNYSLLSDLAFYLGVRGNTKNEMEATNESISIYERIRADCPDNKIRYNLIQHLAYAYRNIGEKEKAIELAEELPYMNREGLLGQLYDGEKRVRHLKSEIMNTCESLGRIISREFARAKYNDDKDIEGIQKRIKLCKKAINIYNIIYENGDYGFYNERMGEFYLNIAANYILLQDFENTLDCLEKASDYMIAYDTLPDPFTHTSILFEGHEHLNAYVSKSTTANDSYEMLHDYLSAEKYNPIRETERFKAVVAKLEQYASKE